MTLRSQITAAVELAFDPDYLGEEVEYNGVLVDGIFRKPIDPHNRKGGTSATATLQVKVSEVPSWAVNDEVLVAGQLWKVKREDQGSTWYKHVLHLERDRRMKP